MGAVFKPLDLAGKSRISPAEKAANQPPSSPMIFMSFCVSPPVPILLGWFYALTLRIRTNLEGNVVGLTRGYKGLLYVILHACVELS